jgi:hypothetical protein
MVVKQVKEQKRKEREAKETRKVVESIILIEQIW